MCMHTYMHGITVNIEAKRRTCNYNVCVHCKLGLPCLGVLHIVLPRICNPASRAALVAQLANHWPRNLVVAGSNSL